MSIPTFRKTSGISSVNVSATEYSVGSDIDVKIQHFTNTLPARTQLHLSRKIWHMLSGLLMISLYMAGMPQQTAISILSVVLVWSLGMEVMRLRNPRINERCVRFFGGIIRSNEVSRVSGMPYYIASALIAIAIFPKPVAILSLLYLALGDPLASLVGILYARRSVKIFDGKSLHGTAAGYVVCALSTWLYLRSTGMHGLDLIRLTLLGGFAGAFAELLPLEIDDNFSIPIVSGFILWLGFIAVHFV